MQEVARSRRALPGQFLSRRCFTLCITVEVEPRIAKQYKCQYCCSCKNLQVPKVKRPNGFSSLAGLGGDGHIRRRTYIYIYIHARHTITTPTPLSLSLSHTHTHTHTHTYAHTHAHARTDAACTQHTQARTLSQ